MRRFKVTVDGRSYNVEVEELGFESAPVVTPIAVPVAAPIAAPVAKPIEKAVEKAEAPVAKVVAPVAGGTPVTCPMPGVINDVKVANGTSVKNGDTIVIMEAMKMEIAIRATKDGVVTVTTSKGSTVNAGDVLAYIA